ncbi:MAG: DUF4105 domain-containing protein [Kofleriaceae bacterium]
MKLWVVATLGFVIAMPITSVAQPGRDASGELRGRVEPEPPFIDVMTFGTGEVIFEKFGHAAICLRYHDPARPGVCFNYGVTDFDAGPILIWNFVRSNQTFWVEDESEARLRAYYVAEDRDIWVQTLRLTPAQARSIEARLWHDVEPANRHYTYDHFLDNCTTRVRDLIDRALGGALRAATTEQFPLRYRELGYRGLAEFPPLVALVDFVVGRQVDQRPTLWEAMFHPDVLRQVIETKLGVVPVLIHRREGLPFPTTGSSWKLVVIALALAFALPLAIAQGYRRLERAARIWATLYLSLWGISLYALVILSPIEALRWNEVVLVLMPFDLVLAFLGPERCKRYAQLRVAGLALVSLLCAVGVLHQPLWMPIITALLPLSVIAFDLPNSLPGRFRPEPG